MQQFAIFALLGLGVGALYSLVSQGLIVIYRGSGVLNFAQGIMGCIGAYVEWELQTNAHLPYWLSFIGGVGASALLGVLTQVCVIRQLRQASPLARIVSTLGILTMLSAAVVLRYGNLPTVVHSQLPTFSLHITNGVYVSVDQLILVGIAAFVTVALTLVYTKTKFGLATVAVAENQRAASALGLSPDRIAVGNWAIGTALAGAAAILIAPIVQLEVATMTQLMLAALAAALVARFKSFPVAFWAGIGIGVSQSVLQLYITTAGVASSLPFVLVVFWLVITGQGLPLRDFFLQRLPAVGNGRIKWVPVFIASGLLCLIILNVNTQWQSAIATTFGMALILLSIVVVTGYAGQLSLAQYALAGVGALLSGQAVAYFHMPFLVAIVIGAVGVIPVGLLIALPAVRTRGVNLAIVTVGIATALEVVLFNGGHWNGGYGGLTVGNPRIFGIDISSINQPGRYAMFTLAFYLLMVFIVSNVRRGRSGRRMLAVRANERAAASMGISVKGAKLYAFGLASSIAAVGGTLLAFSGSVIVFSGYTASVSISVVAFIFVGGIGYLGGPIMGATLASGTVGAVLLNTLFPNSAEYLQLIGGVLLVVTVIVQQNGIMYENVRMFHSIKGKLFPKMGSQRVDGEVAKLVNAEWTLEPVSPRTLEVENIRVQFGGVVAVSDVSFTLLPGKIFGLIGPNGAGKTTVIDALTGFQKPSGGRIKLDGADVTGWDAAKRSRAGIGRSFQSLELFEEMTVLENIRTACDDRNISAYATDLVYPANLNLPGEAIAAVKEFGLEDYLTRRVEELPYGVRRLVAIARAVAMSPSVLLLDEPSAGLDSSSATELAKLIKRLPVDWGIGVLLVEHNMETVMAVCDEILVLDFGIEIARGIPEEIRKDPAVLRAYLGEDSSGSDHVEDETATSTGSEVV